MKSPMQEYKEYLDEVKVVLDDLNDVVDDVNEYKKSNELSSENIELISKIKEELKTGGVLDFAHLEQSESIRIK